MKGSTESRSIDSTPRLVCYLCSGEGKVLYGDLTDRLYNAPGYWSFRQCLNAHCGLVWLDPMPTANDLPKAYDQYHTHGSSTPAKHFRIGTSFYERIRNGYLGLRFGYPATTVTKLLGLLAYVHPGAAAHADFSVLHQPASNRSLRLLDVGSGDGTPLERLSLLGWQHLKGVDSDPVAVETARAKGLDVEIQSAESGLGADSSIDIITMTHLIEHVSDPCLLLRNCHRALRPGGKLVVVTPNVQSLGHRRFESAWLYLDPPRHLYLFSRRTLLATINESADWDILTSDTSIRGAGLAAMTEQDIRETGRTSFGVRRTAVQQLRGHSFYYQEAVRKWFGRAEGEELVVVAAKR